MFVEWMKFRHTIILCCHCHVTYEWQLCWFTTIHNLLSLTHRIVKCPLDANSRGLTDGSRAGGGGDGGGDGELIAMAGEGSGGPRWRPSDRGSRWSRREGGAGQSQRHGGTRCSQRSGILRWRMVDDWQGGSGGTRYPSGAGGLTGHGREEGARSHAGAAGFDGPRKSLGLRGWRQRTRDPPARTPMKTGKPAVISPHRWWAGGEGLPGDSGGDGEDWYRGGGWGRLAGSSGCSGGLGTVCAAHTHHKATPNTGSTSDRGTTSVVIISQSDGSGQIDSSGQTHIQGRQTWVCGPWSWRGRKDDDGGRRQGMSAYNLHYDTLSSAHPQPWCSA